MKNPREEAIEYVKHLMEGHQKEIEQAGNKRLSCYENYVIFHIKAEMEAQAHMSVLKSILKILECGDPSQDVIDKLHSFKDSLTRQVLNFHYSSSTSQPSNQYDAIKNEVYCKYVRDSYTELKAILRILNKQDGN